MSKRKRRRKEDFRREDINNNINTPFGINPNQLMRLLGNNIDFSQIGNVISSMNTDGLDLNNFNLNFKGDNQTNRNAFDMGPLQGFMNGLGVSGNNLPNNITDSLEEEDSATKEFEVEEVKEEHRNTFEESFQESFEEEFLEEDENIQMLIAIKSIVDSKKADFLDRVIEEYNKGSFK